MGSLVAVKHEVMRKKLAQGSTASYVAGSLGWRQASRPASSPLLGRECMLGCGQMPRPYLVLSSQQDVWCPPSPQALYTKDMKLLSVLKAVTSLLCYHVLQTWPGLLLPRRILNFTRYTYQHFLLCLWAAYEALQGKAVPRFLPAP